MSVYYGETQWVVVVGEKDYQLEMCGKAQRVARQPQTRL